MVAPLAGATGRCRPSNRRAGFRAAGASPARRAARAEGRPLSCLPAGEQGFPLLARPALAALRSRGGGAAWGPWPLLPGLLPWSVVGRQAKELPRGSPRRGPGALPPPLFLCPKPATEKFLLPARPASAPGPRATEGEAGPARQGGLEEAERAEREAPRLPGGLWKEIRAEGLSCDYTVLYGRAQADEAFRQLEKEVEYFEGEFTKLRVFGKWHDIPRKQVTYGDAGLTYTYSGVTFSPKPWIPVLNRIRDRVQLATGHTFNFVLINRYKDGHDHIGEHRDDERELLPRSPIASLSFGARRDFIFRHRASRGKSPSRRIAPVKLQLDHGSLLVMNFPTNRYWYHSLPSRKKVLAPRINLTFRKIRTL